MNQNDYLFLSYINQYYDNIFLEKLIKQHEAGISMIQRKRIEKFITKLPETENPRQLLFLYIMFKRTKRNGYIDEIAKELKDEVLEIPQKELKILYKELKSLLNKMKIEPLEITKQVINNIKQYLKD